MLMLSCSIDLQSAYVYSAETVLSLLHYHRADLRVKVRARVSKMTHYMADPARVCECAQAITRGQSGCCMSHHRAC